MYAIILAGGSGTRLWPKSRENSPKQLQRLVSDKSLFQATVERINPLIPEHKVYVVTNKNYLHKIKSQMPKIPAENIIAETSPLGTSLAIALAMFRLEKQDPNAKCIVLWSDNHVQKTVPFLESIKIAGQVCEAYDGVIIGVRPTFPSTQYGYIQMGDELLEFGPKASYKISRFCEKPNLDRAKEFMTSWQYLWNSGISVWKISKFIELFGKFLPDHYAAMKKLQAYFDTSEEQDQIKNLLGSLEPISIDFAIYEKAKNLAVIPADLGWSDVGNWSSLTEVLDQNSDEAGNIISGKHIGLATANTMVMSGERLVATLGCKDLIIVDTDDAVLVCHKDNAPQVKDLVKKLKEQGMEEYL